MATRINDRGKVFRDPVHGLIRIEPEDKFILDLIDLPVFQRLRRIRQLGVSWLTYHGAEHSRFSHSMGVFNFAQRILSSLMNRYKDEETLTNYLKSHAGELKAAALLHDIGHSPFSHMLERAFDSSADHADKTVELIKNPDTGIAEALGAIDPERVADIIHGTSENRLIVDIVSSQLDADRMDYLLRDSLCTGVEYGKYDSEWVIHNLCVGWNPADPVPEEGDSEFTKLRLCLDRNRGLHSAEQFIIARLHMTMQVYFHRVTRGFEALLLNLFRCAGEFVKDPGLPDKTPDIVQAYFLSKGDLSLDQWLRFDEPVMFSAIATWADADGDQYSSLRRMAKAVLWRDRILTSRRVDQLGPAKTLKALRDVASAATEGLDWTFDDCTILPYKGLLYSSSRSRKEGEEQSVESILLSSGEIQEQSVLAEASSRIIRTLDYEGQEIHRIYYDREKADVIESVLDQHGVVENR